MQTSAARNWVRSQKMQSLADIGRQYAEAAGFCDSTGRMASIPVSLPQARRIAVHAQALDGTARNVLDVVRRLGFLQMDPISTIAPPQHLVLYNRIGAFDVTELDRLIWEERKLFEWDAFIWPVEDLPLVRARMRRRRATGNAWARDFLQANARFRRYVLRELERNGPLLSRELGDVSDQYIWRFLRAQKINLAARKSWCESDDPDRRRGHVDRRLG